MDGAVSEGGRGTVRLDDRYRLGRGTALMSGAQALVRLTLEQARRDRAAGLNTAGYVSGYRGSPLGGVDGAFQGAAGELAKAGVIFEPALNEDLAATAILGTQQLGAFGPARADGVFSLWYGKGPGVDRSGDAFKHGNLAGTSPLGGVLLAFGDDHPGKSSTTAHQSEPAVAANQIPILYPQSVEEIIGYGLLGWAMSRYCGLWVGLKLVNETAETTAIADVTGGLADPVLPDGGLFPPEGVHYRGAFDPARDEQLLNRFKLPLAHAFARANRLDRVTRDAAGAALCVVTAGKSHADVIHALRLLEAAGAGPLPVRVFKAGMIWPLEPQALREAADGCREVFVVEEKRAFMEDQAARILANGPRIRLTGKTDETGAPLLPADGQLTPREIALAIAGRLVSLGCGGEALEQAQAALAGCGTVTAAPETPGRTPYFCSGCPHNTSTRTPEGALSMSGIGCHSMAIWMNRQALPPVQMGAEGANWIGASRFSQRGHMLQNLGDGTFSHSGLLAIRAAAAAGVNITYKVLFNDAVAMTGGQQVEGALDVPTVVNQVLAAGAAACVVVAEEPERHRGLAGAAVHPRADFDQVQTELAETPGVTVLIYDQVCAAEKRRRRKKGAYPDPDRRLFINAAVCEGCGDCTAQSNCVSVLPRETPLGRKREIDQSNCNKDYSCLNGFCPAFVSVRGAAGLSQADPAPLEIAPGDLPDPAPRPLGDGFSAVVTGVGGAGVITVGAVLTMAAHLQGLSAAAYNMTGLAQKGGAVMSHLRIAPPSGTMGPARVGAGEADLLLGCDLVVAGGAEALSLIDPRRTHALVNSRTQPTAAFQQDRDFVLRTDLLSENLRRAVGDAARFGALDATGLAKRATGEALAANLLLTGYAYQRGLLPLTAAAIEEAIRLNGTAVALNIAAFRLGRLAASNPERVGALAQPSAAPEPGLDELIAAREAHLAAYQNAAYAARFRAAVDRVRETGREDLVRTVAVQLSRLMAYKDEYEVARLFAAPAFRADLAETFAGDLKLTYHLAPPWLSARKRAFGPRVGPVFGLLHRLKGLRGTPFDPFGAGAERRMERRLIGDYLGDVKEVLETLSADNAEAAAALLSWPDQVRGFGHVKAKAVAAALDGREGLRAAFHAAAREAA